MTFDTVLITRRSDGRIVAIENSNRHPPVSKESTTCIVCQAPLSEADFPLGCPHCNHRAHRSCLREHAEIVGECPACHKPLGIRNRELTGEESGLISGPSILGWWGAVAKARKQQMEIVAQTVWNGQVTWQEAARRHAAYWQASQEILGPLAEQDARRRRRRKTSDDP